MFDLPTGLTRLIAEGVWPSPDGPSMNAQELRPIIASDRVRRFADDESLLCLSPPPFRTIADQRGAGRSGGFWERFGALDHLVRAGEPLPLGELAARLSCVRSNVTQLIDRLEADGLARRVADPADRRSVRAEVTAAGRERWRRGAERFRAVESALEARIGDDDREALARVLALIQEEKTG